MSMVRCSNCDRLVDSDIDLDGWYSEDGETWPDDQFICQHCKDKWEMEASDERE